MSDNSFYYICPKCKLEGLITSNGDKSVRDEHCGRVIECECGCKFTVNGYELKEITIIEENYYAIIEEVKKKRKKKT